MPDHEGIKVAALVVAAGAGERMGGEVPKQYRALGGQAVLKRSIEAFQRHPAITDIRVVIHPDHQGFYEEACGAFGLEAPIAGGATRQASVMNGLRALEYAAPDLVLVHDAARPFVTVELIDRVLSQLRHSVAVVPVVPIADTVEEVIGLHVTGTPIRSTLRAVQTPQGFHFNRLLVAHERFTEVSCTDDASVMELAGHDVTVVEGDAGNRKLTTPEDWNWAEWQEGDSMDICTGQGFDVHRFVEHETGAEAVIRLGGISIPHTHRLEGHSDADAVLHAITDALLGAAGAGDIGQHFPPSEERWKGADSLVFLQEALSQVKRQGGTVQHVDVTVIAEAPKIGPHRDAMRSLLAQALGLAPHRVNIKATTTETLGFTGRREGLAAQAIATVAFRA